ncbi:MAG: AAA family ATPase [Proteobacteria bacterium]|nr:AAA family ATPase [Pseudomonadota bacterium]
MQTPPNDEKAERAVLGSVLLDNACLPSIQSVLAATDFYHERHQIIFGSMVALHEQATPIDAVTLGREIESHQELKRIGGAAYLSSITDDVATCANVEHYAGIVCDLSQRRRMITVGREIIDGGYRQEIDTTDYLSESRSRVLTVADSMSEQFGALPVSETIGDAHEEALRQTEPEGLVRTGIGPLDREFGGLWPGLLTVLASRPAMGKSCMAVNISVNAALANKKVLLISLEDTRRFVQWRMMSRLGEVALDRIVNRKLSHEHTQRLDRARKIISCLSLWIEDSGEMSSEQIRRLTLSHVDKLGLDLVVIDHLGHVREKGKDLYESTSRAARTLASIPKEAGIPVMLLHQLSRAPLQRDNKEPQLTDLRQSGEVEQLARVVWLLHRPAYYHPQGADPNEMALIVAKNSHGKTGKVRLHCDMAHMHINDKSNNNQTEVY